MLIHMERTGKNGFTLIEMLVVIAISAILLAIGVPSMNSFLERNAVSGQVNTLLGTVALARSEAIKRNGPVTVCRSENAETSDTPSCAGSGSNDWKIGWMTFLDRDGNGAFDPTQGDVLISVQGAFGDSNSGGIRKNATNTLRFRNTGLLSSSSTTFTFQSASKTPSRQQCVTISATGRARLIASGKSGCEVNTP
jgi:type IV fimbrial biogenesis protein FimT